MSTASMNGDNRPTAATGGQTTAGPGETNRTGLAGSALAIPAASTC